MSVPSALERELQELPEELRTSSLAEAARVCAERIDMQPDPRDLAALLKEFRAILAEIRERSREQPADDDPIQQSQERGPAPISLDSRRGNQHVG